MHQYPALTYPALFEYKTATCVNCAGEIYWHSSARVWLHADSRITVCDACSSTPTKAIPAEEI